MDFRELYALISVIGIIVVLGGQFMLFKHQVSELQKKLDEIAKALEKEKEERHQLLIQLYKSFVLKDTYVLEMTRIDTKIRELEARSHDRKAS